MDRIIGVNTIDLGAGRRGFRGKDTVAGIPGTELAATWHNAVQEELVRLIELCGGTPSNADFTQVAKAIQSGALNFAVATGTANAWVIDLPLAPLAYAAGLELNVIAPASNTSTIVNANVEGLGNRRLKKSNGSDPEIGDLVSGRVYETIDDGTSIRILTPLPSDRLAAPYLGFHGDPVSQSFVTPNQARVSNYTGIVNNLPGASHAGGIITIGTTGYYSVTANMAALMPSTTGSYGYTVAVSKVDAGGAALQSIAALPVLVSSVSFPNSLAGSASGIAKIIAGERVAAFFGHNNPSNQNMSISLDIEFRGA